MRREPSHDFVFYHPELDLDSRSVDLTGDEHHHLRRVLRMSAGEVVFVSNGRGAIVRCRVDTIGRDATRLVVGHVIEDRTGEPPLTLALACLKKDAFEHAVKQCSELGVTRFLPFVAAKSHIKMYSPTYLERLSRIALSAMKQSFRSILPTIGAPLPFDRLIDEAAACSTVMVADAEGAQRAPGACERPALLVVGPEAGLVAQERDRLIGAGAELIAISAHRLRSETAAALLAGLAGLGRGDAD